MAKLQPSASNRRASRRAALAMLDLSGESSRRVIETKIPSRKLGNQDSDWNKIGKDFRKAIGRIDSAEGIARGR